MRPDGALRTAALNTPSAARPAPVAAITVAAADGWSMASAKAIGGHHNRARSGAGMVHSPGSGTMLLGYPLPVASLDAVTVHRHDDVSAVGDWSMITDSAAEPGEATERTGLRAVRVARACRHGVLERRWPIRSSVAGCQ